MTSHARAGFGDARYQVRPDAIRRELGTVGEGGVVVVGTK